MYNEGIRDICVTLAEEVLRLWVLRLFEALKKDRTSSAFVYVSDSGS
jgi:hypothetical protein